MSARRFVPLAFVLATAAPVAAQAPDWNAFLTVRPDPSPYIADWEADPSIVTLVLSYSGSASVAFHLDGRILRGTARVIGGRSGAFEFVRPSQLLLTTRDGIWQTNSVTYEPALRDQLERTGRIPDGDYQFCVDVREGLPEAPGGALLAQACADFNITAPAPPSLVAPFDGDTVSGLPLFMWSPVIAGANAAVSYHARVAEMLPGQAPLEAINNVAQFEADYTVTSFGYPPTALSLRDSARYVWQVQAVDAAGQPLGERQGKSEVWTFTFAAGPTIVAAAESIGPAPPPETVVGRFTWSGVEVRVVSVSDSAPGNFSGRGRVAIIPDVLEPEFEFQSLRLTPDGKSVAYAPRHVVELPIGSDVVDYLLEYLPVPFYINVKALVLTADSATGDRHAGLSGSGVVFLGYGTVDSIVDVPAAPSVTQWDCRRKNNDYTGPPDTIKPNITRCVPGDPGPVARLKAVGPRLAAAFAVYKAIMARSLFFQFDDLRLSARGPEGTLTLGKDFTTGIYGLDGARLTLAADSTSLRMQNGQGELTIKGDFLLPQSLGLIRDAPDTLRDADKDITGIDSTLTLKIAKARVGTSGELYVLAEGLPRARIGETGVKIQTGKAWIDFSSTLSPPGREAGWQGVYFDSARVWLPREWHTMDVDPAIRADSAHVQIAGYRLSVDNRGFSGDVAASRLDKLGPIGFAGFSGHLDSVRFKFTAGTLDTGYVRGALGVPFLENDVAYWVHFTPLGIDKAYAKLTNEPIPMPALHARALIQRGEFRYVRPGGTFVMDARLSIDYDGVALRDVQVYKLSITSEGDIALAGGWLTFDQANEASFKEFPVALDSLGFGRVGPDQIWLGVAGRFAFSDNLPAAAGLFRVFAGRTGQHAPWQFTKITVDKLNMSFANAAVMFRGALEYVEDDAVYGDGFKTALQLRVKDQFDVDGTFRVGVAPANAGAANFRYWYVDAKLTLPPPGIPLATLPLSLYGFGGGAYSRMRATLDTLTLKAKYIPNDSTLFGLKALVSLGTKDQQGYAWNADVTLEATVAPSGGLQSLTLRGDHWMLTEVSKRAKKVWGSVVIDLPVSQPVFHADMVLNVDLRQRDTTTSPSALRGTGWAEIHFEPSTWYVNVGTRARPNAMVLLPDAIRLQSTSYLMLNPKGIDAGFAARLQKVKQSSSFYGKIDALFEANAEMRYRPFMAAGDGTIWGEIVAKVKSGGSYYTLMEGNARATMAFHFPDPTRMWGEVRLRYKLLNGSVRGTYKMRYSWGDAEQADDTTLQFMLVAATSPTTGETAAAVSGVTYYLGMSEGAEYGTDDGSVYRMRLTGTPAIGLGVVTYMQVRDPSTGKISTRPVVSRYESIGTAQREWDTERTELTLKAPGLVTLQPGAPYQATAQFTLEKYQAGTWVTDRVVTSTVTFTTNGVAPTVGQLVVATDPAGSASPLYYGGSNAGAVRVQFSNAHPDLAGRAVVGSTLANGTDTVPGDWAPAAYGLAATNGAAPEPGKNTAATLYGFLPTGGALAPSTSYRFALVSSDSTRREHYAVSFGTSRYATLVEHLTTSAATVAPTRGTGPVSGSGSYLLALQIVLAGPEAITWGDIDSIDIQGLGSGWSVTPRTRCRLLPSVVPQDVGVVGLGATLASACGDKPTFENVFDIAFSAVTDAELPPPAAGSVTVRLRHRREGWQSFAYAIPVPPPPSGDNTGPVPPRGAPAGPRGGVGGVVPPGTADVTPPPAAPRRP